MIGLKISFSIPTVQASAPEHSQQHDQQHSQQLKISFSIPTVQASALGLALALVLTRTASILQTSCFTDRWGPRQAD